MDRTESLLTAPTTGQPTPAATSASMPAAAPAPKPTAAEPEPVRADGDRPPPEPARADPRWARPALLALLLATGLLYLWSLGSSGWANSFYSAAVQAGSESWKAFFYGSSDAANSITVDKTPASLWLMALSVRIFGLSSWSILVPQALLGVASVGVLYAAVRRWYGPVAGLIAGAVLAATPVATLMSRFNNPDALLAFLLVAAAYATVRAVETASTRWITLVGALVGLGFLTKMLQAFVVIPVFAGVYLLAAPTGLGRRVWQLLLSGLAVVVAAGWWVAVVELVPASARPYIGGSQRNSILELTLGYNGLGRITGDEEGSVGGGATGGGGGPFSGQTGWLRMFDTEVGGQISWLLPAALILLVAGLVLAGRAARTDRRRAGLVLWGGWLLVTGLIFSFMSGIFHAYYTVALAPAVGALVGIGTVLLWRERIAPAAAVAAPAGGYAPAVSTGPVPPLAGTLVAPSPGGPAASVAPPAASGEVPAEASTDSGADPIDEGTAGRTGVRWRALAATVTLAVTLAVTAWWSWRLLGRSVDWHPWLRTAVLVVGLAAAVLIVLADRLPRRAVPVVLALGAAAALAGPVAYSLETASTPHTGSIPTAGPFVQGAFGPGRGGFQGGRLPGGMELPGGGQFPGFPGGGQNGATGQDGQLPAFPGGGQNGQLPSLPGGAQGQLPGGDGRAQRGGGMGGLLDAREPSAELKSLLAADADAYTWVAATIGSNNASGYQLATQRPVMAIGGFNGSDPSPTLAQFQRYVADGKIHYFIGGGGFRANGGSSASQEIASWVAESFTAKTVDGVTVYDLTSGTEG
ncbi:dolichyl-phosphate-mannose-protein mannosyltransferase [Micromonospora kangleipakensis]|uniref:Dolichyl-phosphate-mannose-protein mannosyltransferase n=1 Tax=Micromonospora kangleipakensis TaxID=1077942 RepID=A0A4V2GDA4_9ACTN|nr:glycosyltransferase family 39 protein [Micromonospora kangleipakensis]RZU75156.1 dolichyl-phosphate-mannose-protein mannosyltransferase [Micromonospora kangleipakensis]